MNEGGDGHGVKPRGGHAAIRGYAERLRQQEALDLARQLAADAGELQPAGGPPLTGQMAVWLTARYLLAILKLAEKTNGGEPDLKVPREFCGNMHITNRNSCKAFIATG